MSRMPRNEWLKLRSDFSNEDVDKLLDRAERAEKQVSDLKKFKEFVHSYLDSKGIPTHPNGPHSKEGCRIGDRLDIASTQKPSLFQLGDFTLHSGIKSGWKIECDALTKGDWEALAAMAMEFLPAFGEVIGVPRGGLPFAEALRKYCVSDSTRLLLADDVLTTGGSLQKMRDRFVTDDPYREVVGVVVFSRGGRYIRPWVFKVFTFGG
jgi:hypothetical protein